MSLLRTVASTSAVVPKLYVEDVFSAYTYTGNGSTQTITNGIDLVGKGGMVWLKSRTNTPSAWGNRLHDTVRGAFVLRSESTNAQAVYSSISSYNSNGFTLDSSGPTNENTNSFVVWTFRKAPKFFDIVTWVGDNTATGRVISHALASTVGMAIVKATSTTSNWYTWHRATTSGNYLKLNTTEAQSSTLASTYFGNGTTTVDPTSTGITVGLGLNVTGVTYIAYLYAHDTSTDGIIQCGSFTTDGMGNATVNLGWEPQYIQTKITNTTGNWQNYDIARGLNANTTGIAPRVLFPNTADAETANDQPIVTATGFTYNGNASATYIYMAIRRPNKVPTSGTQVYNAIARTGTGAVATVTGVGFAPDLVVSKVRGATQLQPAAWQDRLRGAKKVVTSNNTNAEATDGYGLLSFDMNGISLGADADTWSNAWNNATAGTMDYIEWFFRRAPGVFDEVCYTGTGSSLVIAHNLTVDIELAILKTLGESGDRWFVWCPGMLGVSKNTVYLEGTNAGSNTNVVTAHSTTSFTLASSGYVNYNGITAVAYLFATLAGISKVGSYTGNGTSINLDMGFTTGARFFLVKRTDSTGDWFIFDTVRGIVSANDPHLSLNTMAAEVTTDDSVDPYSLGLTVNQVAATNINVSSATYIYFSVA